jgi:hypothetical protein
MKTNIVCPNKNDPAWKTLVDAIGEDLAYLSFFRNHDVILGRLERIDCLQ